MRSIETLALSPEGMLLIGTVYAFARQLLRYLTTVRRDDGHTRRVEAAIRDTRSEHRVAVVRACMVLRGMGQDDSAPKG